MQPFSICRQDAQNLTYEDGSFDVVIVTAEYEVEEVVTYDGVSGGLNNTDIPDFVYRWTEHEFRKTVQAFNLVGRHTFRFFQGVSFPFKRARLHKAWYMRVAVALTAPKDPS